MGKIIQFPKKEKAVADPLQALTEELHAKLKIRDCGIVSLPVSILSDPKKLRILLTALTNYLKRLEGRPK